MDTANEKTPKQKQERVSLRPEVAERLDRWVAHLKESAKGIKIGRGELVEWLVLSRAEQLSNQEQKELRDRYFSDLDVAAWALDQLRKAKAAGTMLNLKELLGYDRKASMRSKKMEAESEAEGAEKQEVL